MTSDSGPEGKFWQIALVDLEGLIGLSHDDREKVRLLWQQLCAQWWENNRERLKAGNSWEPAIGGKWPYARAEVFMLGEGPGMGRVEPFADNAAVGALGHIPELPPAASP